MNDDGGKNRLQRVAEPSALITRLAGVLLGALLLLLAFRLTSAEFLHESLSQKIAAATPGPGAGTLTVNIGPPHLTLYAAVALLIAGAATFLAGRARALGTGHVVYLGLLVAITAGTLASSFSAANRFLAIVGSADLVCALAAGYAAALLCTLLGTRGKNLVIAAIVAMVALGCAKSLLQYFVEFPDLLQYVKMHPDEALRNNGIDPTNPLQKKLFLSRVNSQEVSGFTSLANVFATEIIPLLAIAAGLLIAAIPILRSPQKNQQAPAQDEKKVAATKGSRILNYKSKNVPTSQEIQVPVLAFVLVCIVWVAGAIVMPLTDSKGALIAGILAVAATVLAGIFWEQVLARRRVLLIVAAGMVLAGAAGVVGYGKIKDRLPTQSLAFRWHYWTASVPIVEQHAVLGVGLNNFGDYYLQTKRPSSPEDVKDPHNFFVRLAAEAGLPVTALIALLLLWLLWRGVSVTTDDPPDVARQTTSIGTPLIAGAITASLWAWLHFQFAEEPNAYNLELTVIYAIVGFAVFAGMLLLLDGVPAARGRVGTPYLLLAVMISTAGMLLYDQVNMALVTGPVAMLFWMLLATAEQPSAPGAAAPIKSRIVPVMTYATSAAFIATAALTLFLLTIPIAAGTFAWDPTPYEKAYVEKYLTKDISGAQQALAAAIDRAPRSIDLLTQRIALRSDELHLPIADEIRKVLSLDRANAPIRISLAMRDSDLPAKERAAILQDALNFNAKLPLDEIKRLPPEEVAQVEAKIESLNH